MAQAVVTVKAQITGLPSGEKVVGPIELVFASAPIATTEIALASGFNSLAVPADSHGCIIIFPATSTTTKTIKGITGDTGRQVAKTGLGAVLTWDSTAVPTTLGITASGADTGLYTEIVFF